MADILTSEQRHKCMAAIKGKNTKPEMIVRRFLHSAGYRYGLHNKKLPGKPDIVLRKYKTVIFIHGCFWHGHDKCKYFRLPKTNEVFWQNKIARNCMRDQEAVKLLRSKGWNVITIWECELKKREKREKVLSNLILNIQHSPSPYQDYSTYAKPLVAAEMEAEYK